MATHARQQYFADENSLSKERREFSIADEIQEKIDSVEEGAQVNKIETVKVNGTALVPDIAKAVNVEVPDVIDNLYTVAADDALSAKQGKILYDYIQNLQTIGRFLSNWDSATGLPITNPSESPYLYKAGDYYRVSNVAASPASNYKPDGSSYTIGVASTTVETLYVAVSDLYLYDGTDWILLSNSGSGIAVDSSLSTTSTNPVENRVITNALNGKHPGAISNVAPSNPVEGMLWYDTVNDELKTYDGTAWQTEGTKMVVLEYGVSTWQDFIDAYNENAIVYCKVSSGSSGYRMAFMAYTAGQGTPTEVEFQYYRSRSSHSQSSTQLDEVYVYKLTNAGVWTITQRDTGAEMIAGSGIGITFNSSGATINNTGVTSVNGNTGAVTVEEVPSGGTEGQVLTQTNNGPAWQNPTGGAEIVYATQAEYNALPSSKLTDGKHYFIYSTSVVPPISGRPTITGFMYENETLSVPQSTYGDVNGLTWKPDGTKFYITGEDKNTVYQFSCSTAWDVTTGTYDNKSVATTLNVSNSIMFSDDGLTMWIAGGWRTGYVYKWALSTAWDVSTASYVGDSTGKSNISFYGATGYYISDNGNYLYVLSRENNRIRRYTMLTPYDITTLDVTYQEYSITNNCHKVLLNPQGTQLFYYGRGDKKIHICALSTPFDLTTISETSQYSVPTPNSQDITSVTIDNEGNSMWIGGWQLNNIYVYSTTTA